MSVYEIKSMCLCSLVLTLSHSCLTSVMVPDVRYTVHQWFPTSCVHILPSTPALPFTSPVHPSLLTISNDYPTTSTFIDCSWLTIGMV